MKNIWTHTPASHDFMKNGYIPECNTLLIVSLLLSYYVHLVTVTPAPQKLPVSDSFLTADSPTQNRHTKVTEHSTCTVRKKGSRVKRVTERYKKKVLLIEKPQTGSGWLQISLMDTFYIAPVCVFACGPKGLVEEND